MGKSGNKESRALGLEGTWVLTHLNLSSPESRLAITLNFEEAECRVSGSAGCNRYFGRYTFDSAQYRIEFGEMAVTRMMCPPEIMKWEDAFLLAFTQITHFGIEDDHLLLKQGSNVLIRARRNQDKNP